MSKPTIPDELEDILTAVIPDSWGDQELRKSEALAKLNQLISKREIEARIDELAIFVDELNDRDPYVPLPGTPRDYVMDKFMKRLAKLTELQEGEI